MKLSRSIIMVSILIGGLSLARPARADEPATQPAGEAPAVADVSLADVAATQPSDLACDITPITADKAKGAKDLMPLAARQGEYTDKVGKKKPREFPFTLAPADDGQWCISMQDFRCTWFQPEAGGGICVPREDDSGEKVKITYDPPLEMLPGKWPATLAIGGVSKMVVKNAGDGSTKAHGTCAYHVELLGTQHIHTAAGEFDAYLVREIRRIRLGIAKVDVVCDTWYVPGKGDVAEHVNQKTKALGVFGDREIEDMRLVK